MRPRDLRRVLLVGVAIVVIGLVALYFFVDPTQADFFPRCVFLQLSGYRCPGCGSQRALHALLNGHPAEAIRFNAAWLVGLPLLVTLLVAEFGRNRWPRFHRFMTSNAVALTIVALLLLWWVGRNILEI